ncbi:MAG TPA: tetratricopeptide repeat protein [Thermoanaerobaculia bacterium]|jgi:tetratricopeptide (TPR) repeat protein|nr:tetratricopeptide repeat protein [Thermoanaerobaculia bacterium]
MTDQPFPDRVTQLRRRWEADRTSRLFLQLAEEYRQLGRLRESVEVLDAGLVEHPGYLSALVAKGRCHLELDEPQAAREALERVVRQDATQAVASKLLVRAYIDLGELARARERLSLYALLHETDPDIAELRRRLEAPDFASPVAAAAISGTHDQPAADPLGVEAATPARSDAMNQDIFDLRVPSRQPVPPSDDLFGLYQETLPDAPSEGEIFAGLGGSESRRRWAEGLAFGGIFDLRIPDLPPIAPLPPATPISLPAVVETSPPAPPASPQPIAQPIFATAPKPAAALGFEPPVVEPEIESENETVTLAELYLRQGHREEAIRILGQVLRREPENMAAQDLAARIRTASLDETLVTEPPAASVVPAVPPMAKSKRKIQFLTAYLERLRRGSAPGVS